MWRPGFLTFLLVCLSAACVMHAEAQEPPPVTPDTVEVAPDTLNGVEPEEPEDEIDLDELVSPSIPIMGDQLDDRRPTLRPVEDITQLLRQHPGSFRHDLGEIGWPHGWSPLGLHPNRQDLLLNRRAYDDLLTGRPHFELLPIDIIGPVHLRRSPEGAPYAVTTRFPDFDQAEPLTEIRYRRSAVELSGPMQAVNVFHSQRRRLDMGGPGIVNIMSSYAGRASDNIYPNSALNTERNLLARIRYRTEDYSLEVRNHNARRRIGARGSVLPTPGNFNSIYNVNLANIDPTLSGARRRVVRNDLSVTGQLRPDDLDRPPVSSQVYWTRQFNRYTNQPDTLDVVSDRMGLNLHIPVQAGRHHLTLEADGHAMMRTQRDVDHSWHSTLHAGIRDSLHMQNVYVRSSAFVHALGRSIYPTGSVDIETNGGTISMGARLQRSIQKVGWLEQYGMEPFMSASPGGMAEMVSMASLRAAIRLGPFNLETTLFAHQTDQATELVMGNNPQLAEVVTYEEPLQRAGLITTFHWRRDSESGPYATGHATASVFPDHPDRSLPERAYFAIPEMHGLGRVGWRAVVFQGDLDFDLYVQGHLWSTMRGRTIHPPSGLLALPPTEGRSAALVPMDGMIDIQAEAVIRDATLFLAYDNALSGTALQPGTFNSPIFPLPAQQFRFGVHWPILY